MNGLQAISKGESAITHVENKEVRTQSVCVFQFRLSQIYLANAFRFSLKTLPEAQRTQGIASLT